MTSVWCDGVASNVWRNYNKMLVVWLELSRPRIKTPHDSDPLKVLSFIFYKISVWNVSIGDSY